MKLPTLAASCQHCGFRSACGGLAGQQAIRGCFADCGVACGADCDWVCPAKSDFVHRVQEVGGLESGVRGLLPLRDSGLPLYAPVVRHRYSRKGELSPRLIALTIDDVLRQRRGRYEPVADSPDGLRRAFRVHVDSPIIVVSVAPDRVIERFWALHESFDAPTALAGLDLLAMTVPNYSFFDDAPRTHTMWNRRRMERVAEALSLAGVPVVPHLNAVQPEDWGYWARFLSEHADVHFVAKEFQTGNRGRELGDAAIKEIRALQEKLGRALHPILVGAGAFAYEACAAFERVTFVGSTAFMNTTMRHRLSPSGRYLPQRIFGPLDALLEENIRQQEEQLRRIAINAKQGTRDIQARRDRAG